MFCMHMPQQQKMDVHSLCVNKSSESLPLVGTRNPSLILATVVLQYIAPGRCLYHTAQAWLENGRLYSNILLY